MNIHKNDLLISKRITPLTVGLKHYLTSFKHNQILSALKIASGYKPYHGANNMIGYHFPFERGTHESTKKFVEEVSKELSAFRTLKPNHFGDILAKITGFSSYKHLEFFQKVRQSLLNGSWSVGKQKLSRPTCFKGDNFCEMENSYRPIEGVAICCIRVSDLFLSLDLDHTIIRSLDGKFLRPWHEDNKRKALLNRVAQEISHVGPKSWNILVSQEKQSHKNGCLVHRKKQNYRLEDLVDVWQEQMGISTRY